MGGANSEVTDDTTEILFESANFKAENVRATSKKLGLRTESSSRFEKGINQDLANLAVDRAAQLVELLGAGRVLKGVVDEYPTKHEPKSITVNVDRINRLIGVEIPASEMIAILESLEFKCELNSSNEIIAKVPSFRLDMEQEAEFLL